MSGLIDTTTGLRFGDGLHWEPGLGGAGLTNPEEKFDTILFAGAGNLSVSARLVSAAQASFSGAGSVSIATFVKGAQLDQANFAGVGSLSIVGTLKALAAANFTGVGALSALAVVDSVATAWDPVNIGNNITLSNGNLTATATLSGTSNTVRSLRSRSSGKHYFEVAFTTLTAVVLTDYVGLVNSTFALTSDNIASTTNSVGWGDTGNLVQNSATAGTPGAWNTGTPTLSIAIDLDNSLFWGRVNGGNWNANPSADPATGVGGISFATLGAAYVAMTVADVTDAATVNFGGSAFTYTAPLGFGTW